MKYNIIEKDWGCSSGELANIAIIQTPYTYRSLFQKESHSLLQQP